MTAPALTTVVKLQRRNGRVVTDCDVYIGRRWSMGGWRLPQSKWHNPFTVKQCGSAVNAIKRYEEYLREQAGLRKSLHELQGKRLGCWCKPAPCHGDVLAKYANALSIDHNKKNMINLM